MQMIVGVVAPILLTVMNIPFGESYPAPYTSAGDTGGGGLPGGYTAVSGSGSFPAAPSVSGLPSPTPNSQSNELSSNSGNTASSWTPGMAGTNSTMSLYLQQQQGATPQMAGLSQNPYVNSLPSTQSGENPYAAANQINLAGAQDPMLNAQNPNSMASPMSSLAAGGSTPNGVGSPVGMNMLGFSFNSPYFGSGARLGMPVYSPPEPQNPYANNLPSMQSGGNPASTAANPAGALQNAYSMANPMSQLVAGGPFPGGGGPFLAGGGQFPGGGGQFPGGGGPNMGMGTNMLGFGFNNPYNPYAAYFGSGARLGMPGSNPFGGGGGMPVVMPGMYPMPGMPYSPYSMFGQMNPYFGGYGGLGTMPSYQSPFMNGPGGGAGNPMAQYG